MISPFVNTTISLMIKKGSDINMENFEFIAEGSKDYVTLLLSVLQFSDP